MVLDPGYCKESRRAVFPPARIDATRVILSRVTFGWLRSFTTRRYIRAYLRRLDSVSFRHPPSVIGLLRTNFCYEGTDLANFLQTRWLNPARSGKVRITLVNVANGWIPSVKGNHKPVLLNGRRDSGDYVHELAQSKAPASAFPDVEPNQREGEAFQHNSRMQTGE